MNSEAADKLARTIRSGFRTPHNCVTDEIADNLAAQHKAMVLEVLGSDEGKAVVREIAREGVDKERLSMTGDMRILSPPSEETYPRKNQMSPEEIQELEHRKRGKP